MSLYIVAVKVPKKVFDIEGSPALCIKRHFWKFTEELIKGLFLEK